MNFHAARASFRFSGNSLEKGVNEHFNYLYGPKEGNNAHDEKIEYNSFDKYCYLPSGEIPLSIFVSIRKISDNADDVSVTENSMIFSQNVIKTTILNLFLLTKKEMMVNTL